MMVERVAASAAALDIQTGGGEVLAQVAEPPALLVATESRRQNLAVAKQNLKTVGRIGSRGPRRRRLPFRRRVLRPSRQQAPTVAVWDEIARVLRPGGSYLSQQVGAGSVRELTDFMMGPQPVSEGQHAGSCRLGRGSRSGSGGPTSRGLAHCFQRRRRGRALSAEGCLDRALIHGRPLWESAR